MELSCPISAEQANENVVRLIAGFVAAIALSCVVFDNYWAMFFLSFDFGLRAFTNGRYSLLKFLAQKIAQVLSFENKPTGMAPKKFAAGMGFAFSMLILMLFLFHYTAAAMVLSIALVGFAILESAFAVCIGCYVYSFVQLLRKV